LTLDVEAAIWCMEMNPIHQNLYNDNQMSKIGMLFENPKFHQKIIVMYKQVLELRSARERRVNN
jgi:hypothetical protein